MTVSDGSTDRRGKAPAHDPALPTTPTRRRIGRPSVNEADVLSRAIVDAALQEFRARGFAGASIERIAAAANVTRAAIYRRYTDKQALFSSVAETQIAALDAVTIAASRTASDPLTGLIRGTKAYLHFVLSPIGLDIQRIVIAEASNFAALNQRLVTPLPTELGDHLDTLVAEAQASGQLREAPRGFWREVMFRLVVEGPRWQAMVSPSSWSDARTDADFDRMWPLFLTLAGGPNARPETTTK